MNHPASAAGGAIPTSLAAMIFPDAADICGFGDEAATLRRFNLIQPAGRYRRLNADSPSVPASGDCLIFRADITQSAAFPALWRRTIPVLKSGGQAIIQLENPRAAAQLPKQIRRVQKLAFESALRIYALYQQKGDTLFKQDTPADAFQIDANADRYYFCAIQSPAFWPLRIYASAGETQVCSRIRLEEPLEFCSKLPCCSARIIPAGRPFRLDRDETSGVVLIRQRLSTPPAAAIRQLQAAVENGAAIVEEWDDDPFLNPAVDNQDMNPLFFSLCHGISVSTPALAAKLGRYNPNVRVFKNHLRALPAPRQSNRPGLTLFFGAINREKDYQAILPALNEFLLRDQTRPTVKVIHDRAFFNALATPHKTFIPFCDYHSYEETLRTCDIALLPLLDTEFNRMKSDLKFIECAGHGVIALASPTVYENTIRHGETGFIYRTREEFAQCLARLADDRGLRQTIAANAYRYVKENRLLSQHYRERYQWYRELLEKLPETNRYLMEELQRRAAASKERFDPQAAVARLQNEVAALRRRQESLEERLLALEKRRGG